MKKSISINLQGLLFHVEEDGYEHLRHYLAEVKAHFSSYAGATEIVADIEGRIAELFAARLSSDKQVITAEDVAAVTAQLGRVADFDLPADDDDAATGPAGAFAADPSPEAGSTTAEPQAARRLVRDEANKKIAGVAAGLAHYFNTNPLWIRLAFVILALLNTSLLGNWDDHVDINFGGISILTYLILWVVMPRADNLPPAGSDTRLSSGGRKLYRDTDHGSVGGVAAGLAHFLKLDVTLIRVLFVVTAIIGGSGLLVYLILWIVVPEARSLSEKLEMRGEGVTLASIDQSLRSDAPPGAGRARVVQENLRSVADTIAPVFRFIFMLIAGFAGFILALVAVAMIVAFGAVLGAVTGVFPGDHISTGDIPVELLRNTLPTWGLVAGFLAFLLPAIGLLLLAIRLFLRRPLLNTTTRLTLFGVWLLSVIALIAAILQLTSQFREHGENAVTQDFSLTTPVVVLASESFDQSERIEEIHILRADSGQPARLTVRVTARGATEAAARQAATQIEYKARLSTDSVLTLPREFRFLPNAVWRDQKVRPTLALPAGTLYRLTPDFAWLLDDKALDHRYVEDELLEKRLFAVENGRFRLAKGPETILPVEDEDSRHYHYDGDEHDVDVHIGPGFHFRLRSDRDFRLREPRAGATRRTYKLTDFERVDLSGAYQARIRKGDTFRVIGRGSRENLDQVRVRVDGTTLIIESPHRFRFNGRDDRDPVLFEIEMPLLSALDVSGASRADVDGFDDREINIDQSGASTLRLSTTGAPLRLDISGSCHTLLTGSTPDLNAELSGASELLARDLQAGSASLDASGASHAEVRVRHDLDAEASGASTITYFGNPRDVTSESNGAGSVRRAKDDEAAPDDAADHPEPNPEPNPDPDQPDDAGDHI